MVGDDAFDHGLHLFGPAHVAGDEQRTTLAVARQVRDRGLPATADHDRGTRAEERTGDAGADSAGPARDQRHHPGQRDVDSWLTHARIVRFHLLISNEPMTFDAPYTLPGVIARASALYGDAPAIVTDETRLTFRELAVAARAAAAALTGSGIRKGDRVAIWAPNSAEWIVAALGIASSGAVLVPLNTRLKGKEAAFILRRSGARLLLTVGEFLGTRYPELLAGESLPALEGTVLLAGSHASARQLAASFVADWPRHPGRRLAANRRRGWTARSRRHHVHVGHDRHAQGRHEHARAERARLHHLGRYGRSAHGRPLPRRQPVLPHLRLQGRLARIPDTRRHDLSRAGVRCGDGARQDRQRPCHGAAGPAHDLPVAARARGARTAAISRRCGSP